MIIVSACLLGENCKYSGGNNDCEKVRTFLKDKAYVTVCPEIIGGLNTPRSPAEIQDGRVIDKEGTDVTEAFERGAQKVLEMAKKHGAELIILKANSPSCGVGTIYDGTFSGARIGGNGKTASLLLENGFKVVSENDIKGD